MELDELKRILDSNDTVPLWTTRDKLLLRRFSPTLPFGALGARYRLEKLYFFIVQERKPLSLVLRGFLVYTVGKYTLSRWKSFNVVGNFRSTV